MPVRRVTSIEEFRNLQPVWDDILDSCPQKSVFLTFEWFLSWWNNLSEDHSLEVLVFGDQENRPFGIAPLMRKGDTLSFMASHEVTDYCDFIIAEEREKFFFKRFFCFLKETFPEINRLELMNIKESSATLVILPGLASELGCTFKQKLNEVAPVLRLPLAYEEYLSLLGRKDRHELRRKLRRLESLPDVRVEKVTRPENFDSGLDIFIQLHRSSSPAKAEFWEKTGMISFFKEMASRLAEKHWSELAILFSGNHVLGALLSFPYFDEVHLYNVTYNQAYKRFSPGYYLFHESIRQAIVENKKEVDFLRGKEKYKYDFGAQDSKIWSLSLDTGEH